MTLCHNALPQSVGARSYTALIAVWVFVLFGAIMPVAIAQTSDAAFGFWVTPFLIAVAAAARFAWIVGAGERRLFEVVFWIFVYGFFGLAPLVQIRQGHWPGTTPRGDWGLVPTAFLVVIAGIAAFAFGVLVASSATVTPRVAERLRRRRMNTVADRRLLYGFAGFALLVNLYYLSTSSILQFTQSRYSETESTIGMDTSATSSTIVQAMAGVSLLIAFVALVLDRRDRKSRGIHESQLERVCAIVLIVVLGVALLNTMNPISNARYISATAILGALTALGLVNTRKRFRVFAVSMIVGLAFIFPFADAFRYSLTPEFKSDGIVDSLGSPDFDAFAQVNNAVLFVERDGLAPRQALGVVAFWVPRRIWADKPVDTGIMLAQDRGYLFTNLSAPLWAELYIDGGWLLVVVGMAVFGMVVRTADKRSEQQLSANGAIGIASCILPFYTLIVLRGSLLQAMSYLTLIAVFSIIVSIRRVPAPSLAAVGDPL